MVEQLQTLHLDLLRKFQPTYLRELNQRGVRLTQVHGSTSFSSSSSFSRQPQRKPVVRPQIASTGGDEMGWKVGDKAEHSKWGIGTVVSVKGQGEGIELDIAFPSPVGIKRLLAKFAPIKKA